MLDFDPSDNAEVAKHVDRVTQTLIDLESELNALDAKVGDGDTGSTFAAGAKKIQRGLRDKQLPLDELPTLMALIGEQLATVMGGSSGVLMSILFTSAGQKLEEGSALPQALMHGLESHEALRRRAAGTSYVSGCAATGTGSVSGG